MSWLKALYTWARVKRAYRTFKSERVDKGSDVTFGPFARFSARNAVDGRVLIGSHVFLDCAIAIVGSGTVEIGSNCWIGGAGSTAIGAVSSVRIGSDVIISNNVHIYDNNNHPTDPLRRLAMTRGAFFSDLWGWAHADAAAVEVGDNVWIGEYAFVGKGVTIGQGAIVAAHAVVTKPVPPYSVVAGNPATVVKYLSQ